MMRGYHLTYVLRNGKSFVALVLVLSSTFGLQSIFGPVATAIELEKMLPVQLAPDQELSPEPLIYTSGIPASVTPSHMKSAGATLRWGPTGHNEVQDVYEIRVSSVLTENGEIKTENENGSTPTRLITPEFALPIPSETTYFWQVQSCNPTLPSMCSGWSEIYSVTIDDTAPALSMATMTSDQFDTTVRFAGTAEAGSQVLINVKGKSCATTASATTDWICIFKEDFDFGDYSAVVKAVDFAGNESSPMSVDFSVKELFVATAIDTNQLPAILNVVPVNETPRPIVGVVPVTSAIDIDTKNEEKGMIAGVSTKNLTTDGGIIQSSKNGWQILGLPWFIWIIIAGIISAIWYGILQGRQPKLAQAAA